MVCDSAVDGNIEIPSGGTPQDVHVFNMAGPLEKSKEPIDIRPARFTRVWTQVLHLAREGGGGRPLAVKSLNLSTVYTVDGIYSLTITT